MHEPKEDYWTPLLYFFLVLRIKRREETYILRTDLVHPLPKVYLSVCTIEWESGRD